MAETVVKTVENVDRLFSQIVVNGEVYESENYVAPTPSQSTPQTQPAVVTPETEPSTEPVNTQGEDIYGVDLNGVLHDFVDDTVPDKIQQAVESLDVPSSGGSGKYIKSISQTDGKIMTTEGNITDSVTSGSSDPVTSGAVADVLSALPTDAVLHYSFDELPDYPDGTAELLQTQFDSTSGWNAPSDITVSVENNSLKLVSTGSRQYVLAINGAFSASRLKGKIVKVKIYSTSTIARCFMQEQNPSSYPLHLLSLISQNGNEYVFCGVMSSDMSYSSYITIAGTTTAFIKEIYVGDGSYATPVIDNANGQNNGTNNGGIAVKGVSGKGAYFLTGANHYVSCNYNFTDNFSISCFVKPSDNTLSKRQLIIRKRYALVFVNGGGNVGDNSLFLYFYDENGTATSRTLGTLLLPSVFSHVCLTKEGTSLKCYVNGVLQSTNTLPQYINKNNEVLTIGGDTSNSTRASTIDDLLIFDRALSEAEVMALYLNRGNTPKYYSWADWKISQLA